MKNFTRQRCENFSLEEKKALILSQLDRGYFLNVTWNTKSSGATTRTVKKFVESAFTSGDRTKVGHNPIAHKPEMVSVVDMAKLAIQDPRPWVNINLNELISFKVGSKEYTFK